MDVTKGLIPQLMDKTELKDVIKEAISEMLTELGIAIKEWLIDATFNLALFGGGIMIILYVAGFKNGLRWSGIFLVGHIIVRVILGG